MLSDNEAREECLTVTLRARMLRHESLLNMCKNNALKLSSASFAAGWPTS